MCAALCPAMQTPLDALNIAKLERHSVSDRIAEALRDVIVDGLLPVGEVLRQDEIAARFAVSKIPVREALKRLEAEGLVTFIRNRGAIVASLSTDEIVEYLDIRAMLEAHAARLAAPARIQRDILLALEASFRIPIGLAVPDEDDGRHDRNSAGRLSL